MLKLGDEIEIRPGIVSKDETGKIKCKSIFSRVVSLFAESNDLKFAVPGGLIGVGTRVDPTLCRADRLVGFVLGLRGRLPKIYAELEVNYFLLRRLLGVKTTDGKQAKVKKLEKSEILMVNIGSTATGAKVLGVKADVARLSLTSPACTEIGEKVALSRRIEKHWRLIGWVSKYCRDLLYGKCLQFFRRILRRDRPLSQRRTDRDRQVSVSYNENRRDYRKRRHDLHDLKHLCLGHLVSHCMYGV